MLTKEENELITQTGPGTPGGALMRRYWHPIALTSEMPQDGAPMPVKVLGEELVLFRGEDGRLGLLGLYCAHRCADLSYGRIEDGGLRCLYHGWLFDAKGACLDQPAEPPESRYKDKIKQIAYPVIERAGLVFAYLGEGEPPLLPDYEFLRGDGEHLYLQRTLLECNYLQALEGDLDPAHLSYLHRPVSRIDARNVPGSDKSADMYYREDARPKLETEKTTFGFRIYSSRSAAQGQRYVRITNFLMPNKAAIIGNEGRVGEGYSCLWHVPADDESHYRFDIIFNRVRPVARERYEQMVAVEIRDNRYVRNKRNRYQQDRGLMKTSNYTGMGNYFSLHDAFASESQGPIHNRSRENLGTTDTCIVVARRQLLDGVRDAQSGRDPVHVIRDDSANDMSDIVVVSEVIPQGADQRDVWKQKKLKTESAAE